MTTALTPAMAAKERLPRTVLAARALDLGAAVATLQSMSEAQLAAHVDAVADRVEVVEPQLRALLPEPARRERLQREMAELAARYPDPASRPPLFGALIAVKDILKADGHPTRCGSALPPEAIDEHLRIENGAVTRAKAAGAIVLGKSVTTEFACSEPGATTNPWDPNHTPGGSSQVRRKTNAQSVGARYVWSFPDVCPEPVLTNRSCFTSWTSSKTPPFPPAGCSTRPCRAARRRSPPAWRRSRLDPRRYEKRFLGSHFVLEIDHHTKAGSGQT